MNYSGLLSAILLRTSSGLLCLFIKKLKESGKPYNRDVFKIFEVQEMFVSGNDIVSLYFDSTFKYAVVRIVLYNMKMWFGLYYYCRPGNKF